MASHAAESPADPGPHPWFIVANASRARAFRRRIGNTGYDAVREWDSPDARTSSAALGEDRPGRLFAAAGATQRSGIDPEDADATPKGQAQRDFLHQLADDLTAAIRGGAVSALFLAAPAPVLHRLRDLLPQELRPAIRGEHAADITQHPTADVFHRLEALRRGEA